MMIMHTKVLFDITITNIKKVIHNCGCHTPTPLFLQPAYFALESGIHYFLPLSPKLSKPDKLSMQWQRSCRNIMFMHKLGAISAPYASDKMESSTKSLCLHAYISILVSSWICIPISNLI